MEAFHNLIDRVKASKDHGLESLKARQRYYALTTEVERVAWISLLNMRETLLADIDAEMLHVCESADGAGIPLCSAFPQ